MTTTTRVLLMLLLAAPAAAQERPMAQPGGVATMVVTTGPGADTVHFRVVPSAGVRVFSESEGRLTPSPGRMVRIPFTFGLPAHAAAGPFPVAVLTLEWSDGERETRQLLVDVAARRGATVDLTEELVTAAPGSMAEVGYRVRNDGNAPDTFRLRISAPSTWLVPAPEAALVLPAGEEAIGVFHIRVPHGAGRGEEHVIRVVAEGSEVREIRSASVMVVGEESRLGNLATVPGSIFVGSTFDGGGSSSGVALNARGEIRPGTRVTLDARHLEASHTTPALRSALSGPRLRLGLEGEHWSARAGDLISFPDLIQGPAVQSRGVEGAVGLGGLEGEVSVARPWSYTGVPDGGHLVRAAARYRTDVGSFGIRAGSVRRDTRLFGGYEQAGAALTYAFRGAGHTVEAEAGALRLAEDGGASATGLATQLRYSLHRGPVSLSARVRTVPGTTSRTTSHGNETFVSGDMLLGRAVAMTGSAYATEAARIDGRPHTDSRGATGGFRFRLPAGSNARLMGTYRSTDMVGQGAHGAITRTLAIGGDVPVAGVVLEADAQLGRTRHGPSDRPYRSGRFGGRWSQAGQWAWLGFTHYDFGLGASQTRLEVSGAARVGSAELQGGLSSRIDRADELGRASIWSGLTVPVMDQTRLVVGMEHRGFIKDTPWRFSLGAGRTFGMPMPVNRAPVLQGVIFEDLDGDGIRGPGESGLPDVIVTLGRLRTRTDDDGRFRFYDTGTGPLRVDPASLPQGMAIRTGTALPGRGTATIPVVRTGSLEFRIFLDRTGDGVRGDDDPFAAGAVVTIRDAAGESRDAVADGAGRARFGGLAPGRYAVTIQRPNGRAGMSPVEVEVVLAPGAREQRLIALPFRGLPVRLPNGDALEPATVPDGVSRPDSTASGPTAGPAAPVRPATSQPPARGHPPASPEHHAAEPPAADPPPPAPAAVEPSDPTPDAAGLSRQAHPASLLVLALIAAAVLRRVVLAGRPRVRPRA